jgi:ribonuclease Y
MDNVAVILVVPIIGIAAGFAIGYVWRKKTGIAQAKSAEARAEKLMLETKTKCQEFVLKAKEKAVKVTEDAKNEERKIRQDLLNAQNRLEKRENMFDQKLLEIQEKQTKLQEKVEHINNIKTEVEKLREQEIVKLQSIADLNKNQAKNLLLEKVEQESKDELFVRVMKLERESSEHYDEKARAIIATAIQRCAISHASETTSSSVTLPSEEMKGRIIGKEGRNIKTLEKYTGCELIIDDTPETITVSGFSPIRRQVAKIALEKLIADGRIQPARIEEFVEKAKQELALDIKKAGEEALYKMGITGIDPKLVGIIGRLKYRTSYGQNILKHSMEVGYISSIIAAELGLDAAKAKKCGFFHDIGKSIDQETQGTHPEIGQAVLNKFNMDEDIVQAALTHHLDKPFNIYSVIVKSADAISGARIGARKDTYEQFVARLEELEKIAEDFKGVEKVYAIQAGREVRVFVTPNEIDDYAAHQLAKDIARRIEQELQYPGEIKITLIRETRVIEYAK